MQVGEKTLTFILDFFHSHTCSLSSVLQVSFTCITILGLFYLCIRSLFAAHLHSRFLPLAHVLALVSSPGMSDGGLFYLYSRSVYEVHVRSDGGEGMPIVVGLFYLYSRSLLH